MAFDFVDLTGEALQLLQQALHEQTERARQLVTCILNHLGNTLGDVGDALRNDEPETRPTDREFGGSVAIAR